MDKELRTDAADMLAGIGRHGGWVLTFGIVTLLAGLLTLMWPGRTIVVIAVLFGIQLVVTGIFRFVAAFAADDETRGHPRALLRCSDPRHGGATTSGGSDRHGQFGECDRERVT